MPEKEPPVKPLKKIRMVVLPRGFDSRRPDPPPDERASSALIVDIPPEVAQLLAESARRRDVRLHTPRVD